MTVTVWIMYDEERGELLLRERQLAALLARAAQPSREEGAGRQSPQRPKKAAADPQPVAQRLRELYDRATDPEVTRELIDAEVGALGPLSKEGRKAVAKALDIAVGSKWSADEIARQIALKIHTRRDVAGRSKMHGIPEPTRE